MHLKVEIKPSGFCIARNFVFQSLQLPFHLLNSVWSINLPALRDNLVLEHPVQKKF